MNSESEIDRLIAGLKIRNRTVREEASRQLQLCGEVAIPKLGTLLMESNGVVAEAAALTLSKIGAPAIPALTKALREGGHGRRKYASIALADIGIAAIPVLEEGTTDEDRGVRWRAFNALARIGAPSIPFIVTKLLGSDEGTRLLILQSTRWELTRADTPDLEQGDAEGNSVIHCLIQLLEQTDRDIQFFGMGMLEKIGLPAIIFLAEYALNCKNEVAEKNCVSTLRGIMFGRGVKGSELAGNTLREYASALFKKTAHITVAEVHLSAKDYEQALNSGDSRVWRERLRKEYNLLFGDLGVLAVPVLASAWLNGTKKGREFSDHAMDLAFGDSFGLPHIPFRNPKDYKGPTSPDEEIFSEVNSSSMEDVNKIVSALEYKYEKIIDDMLKRRETEPSSLINDSPESEPEEQEQTWEEERINLSNISKTLDQVRERAIQTIRDKGVMMLPCIIEMAQNGDDDRCLCAVEALSIINGIDNDVLRNNPALVPTLIRFMKIPHHWYRIRAMASASHIGQPLLPFLSQYAFKAHDELDKLAAVAVMGSIGDEARAYIEPFTLDTNTAVSAFSRWYLVKLAAEYDQDKSAITIQSETQNQIEALKNEREIVRIEAAAALGMLGDSYAVPHLIESLADENFQVRMAATRALGNIGDQTVVPRLIMVLKDEYDEVREAACEALGALGDQSAIPHLIGAINDKEEGVRVVAATALAKLGDELGIPYLLKALKNSEQYIRFTAAVALYDRGDRAAVPQLIQALEDEDESVREAVAMALGKIGDQSAISSLVNALKDEDENVRKAVAEALEKLGAKE